MGGGIGDDREKGGGEGDDMTEWRVRRIPITGGRGGGRNEVQRTPTEKAEIG